jgi:hypothetical protein
MKLLEPLQIENPICSRKQNSASVGSHTDDGSCWREGNAMFGPICWRRVGLPRRRPYALDDAADRATIDAPNRGRDVRRRVGRQKDHDVSDLLRGSEPVERQLSQ